MRDGRAVLVQQFNGKIYRLYPGERYFSRHNKRLHRVVWEYYNGPIPKGYHVHHKDGNPHNNEIDNLELIAGTKHISEHTNKRVSTNPEIFQNNIHKAMEAAKEWHRSPEGRKWHSEHAKAQAPRERVEYTCSYCGKTFVAQKITAKHHFCSNKCCAAYRRKSGVDNETRICEWCGKPFTVNKYDGTRFCSIACGAAHHGSLLRKRKD